MVAEVNINTVPKVIAPLPEEFVEEPQLLADWAYKVGLEISKIASNAATQAGDMKIIGGSNVPSDWLVADGSTVSGDSYPQLQQALLPGDTSSTFVLPNVQALIVDNTASTEFGLDTAIKSDFTVLIKI